MHKHVLQKGTLTFALRLGRRCLLGGGHTEGTLGTVAAGTNPGLPLATWAWCNLSGGLQVVTGRHNCRTGQAVARSQVVTGQPRNTGCSTSLVAHDTRSMPCITLLFQTQ